jgi:cell division protein FtsL
MGVLETGRRLITVALWLAVLASSLAVVYARHENRRLFVELQVLQSGRDELENEWSKLQIEQSFWSGHARVENEARTRLGMYTPVPEQVVIVEP